MNLVTLGIASTLYAVLLNTPAGRRFTDAYTHIVVIGGVLLVLFSLRRDVPMIYLRRVAVGFVVAGSPMVLRSTLNRLQGQKNADGAP